MLETVEKERETLRAEVENTVVRVDRLEREVDYLETQNPAPPCVEVDEKLMDNQVSTAKKRKNEKYDKLTGERSPHPHPAQHWLYQRLIQITLQQGRL